jgi:DNA-directed RNA polymerase beta subunit
MTVGQLIETLLGVVAAKTGKFVDGTPHRGVNMASPEMKKILFDCGMSQTGKTTMYSGITGKPLDTPVFIGLTYYQRLKHLVKDKLHGRGGHGPRQILTRQPLEGRSRNGGFRVGEMEKDGLLSHGATSNLIDRLLLSSDAFDASVCNTCGSMAEPQAPEKQALTNILHRTPYCRLCKSHDNIHAVKIPYAIKLLNQELAACHVQMKFTVEPEK